MKNEKEIKKDDGLETDINSEDSSDKVEDKNFDDFKDEDYSINEVETTSVETNGEELNKKWYKRFKMPKSLSIIFGIILFVMFLTLVIPHQTYAEWHPEDYGVNGIKPDALPWYGDSPFGLGFMGPGWYISSTGKYGILDLPMLLFAGFLDAAGVILFVFAIGMFIEIMMASKTLEAGVVSLEKKLEGKELGLIPILFVLFALGGTTYGMQEETIAFFPIIVPFLLLAGFDALTGFLVIVLGTSTGIAASTVNPFSIGVFADIVNKTNVGGQEVAVTTGTGLISRFVVFIIFTIIGAAIMTFYARRVKNNKEKSMFPDRYDDDIVWARDQFGVIEGEDQEHKSLTKRQTIAFIIFSFTFILMIFSMLPWEQWNVDMNIWLSWIFFGNFILGSWFYLQLILLFTISSILMGFVLGMKTKEIKHSMWVGAKAMTGVAILIGVARTIAISLTYSGLNDAIVNGLLNTGVENASPTVFVLIMFPIFLLLSLFIPSTSGLAGATAATVNGTVVGISQGSVETYLALIAGVMLAYSLAEGIVNLFTPSNGILFAQAEASNMSYGLVLKPLLMYAGLLTVLSLIALPVTTAIAL